MSNYTGIALSRVAGGAPFSVTPVSGPTNQATFGEATEYKLYGTATSEIIDTISRLVGVTASSLSIAHPVSLPDKQSDAIRAAGVYRMDHSTALIHHYDYRATNPEGGPINILFLDLTHGQAAAKFSTSEVDEGEWIIMPEEKTVLASEHAGELSPQDITEKLVIPTVPRYVRLDRIYILRPDGPSSELSSALEAKFPHASIKWPTLPDISRGAAVAINFRPAKRPPQLLCALPAVMPVGITLDDGRVVTAVRRNTYLSTSKTMLFTNSRDSQTTATLHFVTGKKSSGKVVLHGLAPRPKGTARIQVTLDIDDVGETVVTVEDLGSEARSVANLENILNHTHAEIEAYLAELEKNPNQVEAAPNQDGVAGELPE